MAETVADQENFTYIPLSSFIILLVIILTCASRRKKIDAFNAVEQNIEEDFKEDYAVMCFPCLRKKPELKAVVRTTDLTDQFEYIVEKYTIRKVPLLLANTTEDIIERQEEMELEEVPQTHPQLPRDDFVNFQVAQEVYNVQKSPPYLTVAPHTSCPGKRALKERSKPSDVLESMSPIPRPCVKNPNYVVIPTKGSLRHKDIMITKREITNQYLNNFSSVFVDNLKDQVPKDPERFPSLSRPYTSAIRELPLAENLLQPMSCKKSKKHKHHKVAYAFPAEEVEMKEEAYEDDDDDYGDYEVGEERDQEVDRDAEEEDEEDEGMGEEPYYYSDSGSKDQITETREEESESQEDIENGDTENLIAKSKSFVLLNDSDSITKESSDTAAANPFKTTIQSSPIEVDRGLQTSTTFVESLTRSFFLKDDWSNARTVTYEDIQSLDVGYEFTSSEKLGVKPKMTRIPYPHENERIKDSYKQLVSGDTKISKRCFVPQEQIPGNAKTKSAKTAVLSKPLYRNIEGPLHVNFTATTTEKSSSKSSFTETSFLSKPDMLNLDEEKAQKGNGLDANQISSTTLTSQSAESKSCELEYENNAAASASEDTVTEISKMYDLTVPITASTGDSAHITPEPDEPSIRLPVTSKSRSFHELGSVGRKDSTSEAKGKDNLPYMIEISNEKKDLKKIDGTDFDTSCSLSQSKTSSVVTSPRSSDPDEGKRATLRWKIVIKHHRENISSKKNVNKNIKN